jgi:seryl-tRNA synthetase
MWDFFRFKNNEKDNNKNNSRNGEEEKDDDDFYNSLESSNENQKNIFSIVDFPEKITEINTAYPYLKEKEKIILQQIMESLKKGRQKDSKKFFNELSKVRRDLNILETSKKVIEQTSIKLSLIHDISDTLEVLAPIIKEEKLVASAEKSCKDDKTLNTEKEGMITFIQTMTQNILKDSYKEIDIQSIDEIDKVFKKIITYKENK